SRDPGRHRQLTPGGSLNPAEPNPGTQIQRGAEPGISLSLDRNRQSICEFMNHPKREEWIPYLYGEAKPQVQRELKAHLGSCPECRAELAGWKQSLRRLDAWKLPRAGRQRFHAMPILKWSTAATVLLLLGYILGHFTAPKPGVETLRATIEPQIRRDLTS